MKFNRQLFKEAFKAGYKKAKINEAKLDTFRKKYKANNASSEFVDDMTNYYQSDDFPIVRRLREMGDDGTLEHYTKKYRRFLSLLNYIGLGHNKDFVWGKKLSIKLIREIFKTYAYAQDDLEELESLAYKKFRGNPKLSDFIDYLSELRVDLYKKWIDFKTNYTKLVNTSDLDPEFSDIWHDRFKRWKTQRYKN